VGKEERRMKALFELGKVVGTPGALDLLERTEVSPASLLRRHASGDWGEVSEVAAIENALSVREGFRILLSYSVGGEHVWIITKPTEVPQLSSYRRSTEWPILALGSAILVRTAEKGCSRKLGFRHWEFPYERLQPVDSLIIGRP
jgi:hypothetical protein